MIGMHALEENPQVSSSTFSLGTCLPLRERSTFSPRVASEIPGDFQVSPAKDWSTALIFGGVKSELRRISTGLDKFQVWISSVNLECLELVGPALHCSQGRDRAPNC